MIKLIIKLYKIISILVFLLLLLGFSSKADSDYEPNTLIVKLKASKSLIRSQSNIHSYHQKMGVKELILVPVGKNGVKSASFGNQTYVLKFKSNRDMQVMAENYKAQSWVVSAEPNYYVYAHGFNDPGYESQDYLRTGRIKSVFDIPERNRVIVAVADTGIDYNHEDIEANIFLNTQEQNNNQDDDGNGYVDDVKGYNFYGFSLNSAHNDPIDEFGHGTHLAGIIGAKSNNGLGIAGINTKAQLLNVCFLNRFGRGNQVDAAAAITYAVDMGAKIINCSWGYSKKTSVLEDAINYAQDNNVVVVASTGNDSQQTFNYPAAFDSVIAVSAITNSNKRASYASFGGHVDFAAPGTDVYSLKPGNSYRELTGTSQSAAVVTGIIARVLSYNPDLTPAQIKALLIDSADDVMTSGRDIYTGYGVINTTSLKDNLGIVDGAQTSDRVPVQTAGSVVPELKEVLNFPNPCRSQGTTFGFITNKAGEVVVRIFDMRGQLKKTLETSVVDGDRYNTVFWDCYDDANTIIDNGTYFYIIEYKTSEKTLTARGRLSVLR
jgi:subtilisin family serine protease